MRARDRARSRGRVPAEIGKWLARYVKTPAARATPLLTALAVGSILVAGWVQSFEEHLTPESGLGYWLGIAGGCAMLLLLVYPLRKRKPRLRFLGSVRFWFRTHMLLGVAGPVLILFHSNFKLGALNSNVALLAMLTVAASGLVGRYFYSRIHLGMSDRKSSAAEMLQDASRMRAMLEGEVPGGAALVEELERVAAEAMKPPASLVAATSARLTARYRLRCARARVLRQARQALVKEAGRAGWPRGRRRRTEYELRDLIRAYFAAVASASRFALFERLFALWHVLHLPMFLLLIAAAAVHILAVHLY